MVRSSLWPQPHEAQLSIRGWWRGERETSVDTFSELLGLGLGVQRPGFRSWLSHCSLDK